MASAWCHSREGLAEITVSLEAFGRVAARNEQREDAVARAKSFHRGLS
jgi:hypothetical protein